MFTRIRSKNDKGFTLIELLIVIAIIGILATIAIPQFNVYRAKTYNKLALSDAKNLMTAQEAYYVDHSLYTSTVTNLTGSSYGYMQSGNVTVGSAGSADGYTITGFHSSGDKTYSLSGPGGTIATM